MPTRNNSFPKSERLCSKKQLEELFASGVRPLSAFPIRVMALRRQLLEAEPRVQVLMTVSKRRFKHAVDRNRAKRQLREAWRLNRDILLHVLPEALPDDQALRMAFIWMADEPQPTALVERKMRSLLHRLAEQLCVS